MEAKGVKNMGKGTGSGGEMVQTMCVHMNKCINNKRRILLLSFLANEKLVNLETLPHFL
jgi:hypothetical protein